MRFNININIMNQLLCFIIGPAACHHLNFTLKPKLQISSYSFAQFAMNVKDERYPVFGIFLIP